VYTGLLTWVSRACHRHARAQAAAELRPLRWHDLRHTYGSLLAADGVDLVAIQTAMGHSTRATTARYLHARPASEPQGLVVPSPTGMRPHEGHPRPSLTIFGHTDQRAPHDTHRAGVLVCPLATGASQAIPAAAACRSHSAWETRGMPPHTGHP
jgi:hypothetical protein